ncbi:MAG: type II secretion system F family protein [Bdellovibrio sp.]|nr:MAG: type II secretion system F family protein [Bdellovibrio sp.]
MLSFDLILLLAGLSLAGISVFLFLSAILSNQADEQALAWASGNEPKASQSSLINFSRPLVHNFTLQHALKIKNKNYREKVRQKILTAGLEEELNVDEFIGLQILWGVAFPLFLTTMNFALQIGIPYALILLLSPLGIAGPHLYAKARKKERYISIVADLPFFIDLMALSTEAGLDFISAIQKITEKAEGSELSKELEKVLKDIKLGRTRAEALRALSERLDIPEVTSFCGMVIDADQTGTPISRVLKDQSKQMRLERFVRAEKAGARASQLILVPMMVFILPAIFIMVFAPIVIQFFYGGK